MFDDPPGCFMHRQGNFVARPAASRTRSWPTSTTASASSRCPVRRPRASRCSAAVTSPASSTRTTRTPQELIVHRLGRVRHHGVGADGGWISPRTDFDTSRTRRRPCGDRAVRLRVDRPCSTARTRCPARSESGTFWRGMTAWISGGQDTDDAGGHREQLAGLILRPGVPGGRAPGTPHRLVFPPALTGGLP